MHDNIYLYRVKFPGNRIREAVMPCVDGYTIYIDEALDDEAARKAYRHALCHIQRGDLERSDRESAQDVEEAAHKETEGVKLWDV